jgi:DNA invertase Pin-like site-specific DNA recombinase
MFVRAYLRASTDQQDATRARVALDSFASERGLRIAARYVENESSATLQRPELFRLLADSQPGDVLLTEQVDRLARLTAGDWQVLRAEIDAKQVRIVALDLPTSWSLAKGNDKFTGRMLAAVNGMLLDMLAAIARKDDVDRLRRQAEGTAKAKAAIGAGRKTASATKVLPPCCERVRPGSRSTIAKVKKRLADPVAAEV